MSISIEKVTAGDTSTEFFRFGKGKKTLVIVPGLSITSVMNSAQAIAKEYGVFSDDFTVYVFDRSEPVTPVCTVRDVACDLIRAIDKLGLCDLYMFGASLGGMITLEVAAMRPELIHKAAVCSTCVKTTPESAAKMRGFIQKAENKDTVGLCLGFGELIYPPAMFELYRNYIIKSAKDVTEDDLRRFIIFAKAASGYDFTCAASKIRCPLFACASSDDRIFDRDTFETIIETFRQNASFEYYLYEGFGHAVYDAAPDFRDRLYEFFVK